MFNILFKFGGVKTCYFKFMATPTVVEKMYKYKVLLTKRTIIMNFIYT